MSHEVAAIAAFGVLAFILVFLGYKQGFFSLEKKPWPVYINLFNLLIAFAIYFFLSSGLTYLATTFLKSRLTFNYLLAVTLLNFIASFTVLIFLALYLFFLPRKAALSIFYRPLEKQSLWQDFQKAFVTWIIAFPLVLFFSQGLEWLITDVFQAGKIPDQNAVKFLKSTFTNPTCFSLAIISIIILTPFLEEILFRGFLQTFIRKHLGPIQAIIITSVCFALFHFSMFQGLSNIFIIPPLFILALFLGFLYEKQGSLFAPIFLHAIFNGVSVVNLYLFGGFTTGL